MWAVECGRVCGASSSTDVITILELMVWYGMVWYGMVWYGMAMNVYYQRSVSISG